MSSNTSRTELQMPTILVTDYLTYLYPYLYPQIVDLNALIHGPNIRAIL